MIQHHHHHPRRFDTHIGLALLIVSLIFVDFASADRNVTVDDGDSSIVYAPAGAWAKSAQTDLDYGGSHMLTQNPTATASFNFTGTAIYFLSPLWPYNVNTAVSLDSGTPTLIDLVDHSKPENSGQGAETVSSAVLWSATGLQNTLHHLVVSVGQGQSFAVLDGLIYSDTLSASSSASQSPSPSTTTGRVVAPASSGASTSSSSSNSKHVVAIALGTIFALLAIVLMCLGVWYFCRRRRRPVSEAWTSASGSRASASGGPAGHSPGGVAFGPGQYAYAYPQGHPQQGYPMTQTPAGDWHNPQYAHVGGTHPPPPSAYADPSVPPNRAPNRYTPGYTLSTITEKSTPQMGSVGLRTPGSGGTGVVGLPPGTPQMNVAGIGAHSPAMSLGTQMTASEGGYWTPSEVGGYSPPPPMTTQQHQQGYGQYSPPPQQPPQQQNGHGSGRIRAPEKAATGKGSTNWI